MKKLAAAAAALVLAFSGVLATAANAYADDPGDDYNWIDPGEGNFPETDYPSHLQSFDNYLDRMSSAYGYPDTPAKEANFRQSYDDSRTYWRSHYKPGDLSPADISMGWTNEPTQQRFSDWLNDPDEIAKDEAFQQKKARELKGPSDSYIKRMTQGPAKKGKPRASYTRFTPSSSKLRGYIINRLGSTLGQATPNAWRAEQLANAYQRAHSWEAMDDLYAQRSATGVPDSADDYVLRAKQEQLAGTKLGKQLQTDIAATKPTAATKPSLVKRGISGVGNGVLALTSMPLGFQIGTGITQLFGFDPQGQVCTSGNQGLETFAGLVNGVDCDAYRMTQDAQAQANSDASAGLVGDRVCGVGTLRDMCVKFAGYGTDWGSNRTWCFVTEGEDSGGYVQAGYRGQRANGSTYDNDGNFSAANGAQLWTMFCSAYGESGHRFAIDTNDTITGYWVGAKGTGTTGTIREQEADPERTMTCSIDGTDGKTYTQQASDSYRESEGKITAPECPELPDGVTAKNVTVDDGQGNKLLDQPTTEAYQRQSTDYSTCDDGHCALDLLIYDTGRDAAASCFDSGTLCEGWMQDSDRDTRYECRYDGEKVALSECYVYARVFDSTARETGSPYADPSTGGWSGGQSAPTESGKQLGSTVQDPDTMRSCVQDGYASAPGWIEAIFVPVKCALEWAFVPRQGTLNMTGATMQHALDDRAPGQIVAMISGWNLHPQLSGCKITADYSPHMPGSPDHPMVVVDACSGPVAALAGVARTVGVVGFAILVYRLVKRQIAAMVDYGA